MPRKRRTEPDPPSTPARDAAADARLPVIGWREYVGLPEWGVAHIMAKADTGARTSAMDVGNLRELPGDRVHFELVYDRRHPERHVEVETDIVRRTRVKSSFGEAHDRLFVAARVRIGPYEVQAELGLVNRQNMLCRMLLGRKFLEDMFLVDSGRMYLVGRRRRKRAPVAEPPPTDGPTPPGRRTR